MIKRLVVLVVLHVALVPLSAAHAQARIAPRPDLTDASTRRCIAALPDSEFTRTLVSLGADVAGVGDPAAEKSLFLLTQDVATRLREQLGARAGVVPMVDSAVPWTAVWGRVEGELHTDGLVTITEREPRTAVDSMALPGDRLIARALASLVSDGELWPFVPTEWALSWRFTLFFTAADVTVENTMVPTPRAIAVPAYSRSLPSYAPVRWTRLPTKPPDFRRWERAGAFSDSVTFEFRYDEKGRVVGKSHREVPFRDDVEGLYLLLPSRLAREPGDAKARAGSHARFIEATARSLEGTNWSIGRIGSCSLPRVAHQTFVVDFAEGR
jgi:hypothetical protein